MPEPLVTYELDGDVALLGLNRDDVRNAINGALLDSLKEGVLRATEEARAAVIFSHGEKHFSAGLDLAEAQARRGETPGARPRKTRSKWHTTFDLISRGEIPFVSALKGATVGGGLELAAATHVRVADETTFFALPEGQRGIFVGGGGSVRVPRLIGASRMADMMFTGRVYNAEDGERIGLAHYLVPEGKGLEKGIEIAKKIAGNAPHTNYGLMHVLPRIAEATHDHGMMMESMIAGIVQAEPAAKERLTAFLEKRAAKVRKS